MRKTIGKQTSLYYITMPHTCNICDFTAKYQCDFNRHIESNSHIRLLNDDYKQFAYTCEFCNYGTDESKSFSHHCTAVRHRKRIYGKTKYRCGCDVFFTASEL